MGTQVRGPATAHDPLQEYAQLSGHGASDFVRVQDLLDRNQDILAEVNRSVQMMGHYGDQTAQSRLMQEMSDNMLEMHRLYQAATAGLVQTVGEIKRRENPAKQDW